MPARREVTHRVAAWRFEANDACSEVEQLAARERPRQVAGQVDDEDTVERAHGDEEAISVAGRFCG